MTPLFLLLWACSPAESTDPNGPGTDPTNPTEPTDPSGGFEPVPMGVATIEPSAVEVRVDSVGLDCSGTEATLRVDTLGHAASVEVDLVHSDGVHSVTLTSAPFDEGAVWVGFTGTAPCDLAESSTWVVRAAQSGAEADCAVHGVGRDEVLAGNADATLADAGRPAIAGCHDISE